MHALCVFFFFFNDTATTEIYTLSLHDALPISPHPYDHQHRQAANAEPSRDFPLGSDDLGRDRLSRLLVGAQVSLPSGKSRSEEHTSELQSRLHLVCRLLLEKKKKQQPLNTPPH